MKLRITLPLAVFRSVVHKNMKFIHTCAEHLFCGCVVNYKCHPNQKFICLLSTSHALYFVQLGSYRTHNIHKINKLETLIACVNGFQSFTDKKPEDVCIGEMWLVIVHKVVTLINLWCTQCCFQFHSNIVYSETTLVTISVAISPLGRTSVTQTVQLYLHCDSQALCVSSHLENSWHQNTQNTQNTQCATKPKVCAVV